MSKKFLEEVAAALYGQFGTGVSELHILFPSRRARLFFREHLAGQLAADGIPIWQPHFLSIDQMMEQVSDLRIGDRLRLIIELYKVYSRYHTDTFDSFYHWGEMLLADFDAVDNYLIDARMLFVNIDDLKEIDRSFDFLTDEQREVVDRFWAVFRTGSRSREQDDFLSLWNTLYAIYTEYRQHLRSLGFGFKGMVYREAAERLRQREETWFENEKYVLAGFNALSAAERELFKYLRDRCQSYFFWDYDTYYTDHPAQEAGLFIRQNLHDFPDALSGADRSHFIREKELTVIDAPSDALQCRYVAQFLKEVQQEIPQPGKETAIVLTNENLLLPVLYSIPATIDTFNVTTGYQVKLTPAYSLVEFLLSLQKNRREKNGTVTFWYRDVMQLLRHPYVTGILSEEDKALKQELLEAVQEKATIYIPASVFSGSELFRLIFCPVAGWKQLAGYLGDVLSLAGRTIAPGHEGEMKREFLYLTIESLLRLGDVCKEGGIELSEQVYMMALRKMLHGQKAVFEGQPLEGVQVMGILETRNLDFDNVLILSVNEMNFPGNLYSNSFVPANLRFAYGLPTVQYHEAMYAYYFYRLLQRSRRVHIVYNSKDTEMETGEPSRFIHQLRYESPHRIVEKNISLNVQVDGMKAFRFEKNGSTARQLEAFLEGKRCLSPSAFHMYLECPVRFYLRYLAGALVPDDPQEEMDARRFGNIFHDVMRTIYGAWIGASDIKQKIRDSLTDEAILRDLVQESVRREMETDEEEFAGKTQLVIDTLTGYVRQVLQYDLLHLNGTVEAVELPVKEPVEFERRGIRHRVFFAGTIDRIDRLDDGRVRIVDYKTGGVRRYLHFSDVAALFDREGGGLNAVASQLLLYSHLYASRCAEVVPEAYFIRAMHEEDYSGRLRLGKKEMVGYGTCKQDFEEALREKLGELFSFEVPFLQTDNTASCRYCSYAGLCGR